MAVAEEVQEGLLGCGGLAEEKKLVVLEVGDAVEEFDLVFLH